MLSLAASYSMHVTKPVVAEAHGRGSPGAAFMPIYRVAISSTVVKVAEISIARTETQGHTLLGMAMGTHE
jgi:hypothetical protein